jgi:hypothetical protein
MSTARETSCAGSSRTDRGRPAPPCTQKVLVSRSVPISLAVLAELGHSQIQNRPPWASNPNGLLYSGRLLRLNSQVPSRLGTQPLGASARPRAGAVFLLLVECFQARYCFETASCTVVPISGDPNDHPSAWNIPCNRTRMGKAAAD